VSALATGSRSFNLFIYHLLQF